MSATESQSDKRAITIDSVGSLLISGVNFNKARVLCSASPLLRGTVKPVLSGHPRDPR